MSHRDEPSRIIVDAPGDFYIDAGTEAEAVTLLAQLRDRAATRLVHATPAQQSLDWGGFFRREVVDTGTNPVMVYCQITTLEQLWADEEPNVVAELARWHGAGFRYGQHFSVDAPDGEWGSTHVADVIPITPAEFEEARQRGWEHEPGS